MSKNKELILEATLERVRFKKPDSNWQILTTRTPDGKVTITGCFSDLQEGTLYSFKGRFETHERYGPQFIAADYDEIMPRDENGIITYLTHRIKGVGHNKALKIVHKFGTDTFDIIKNDHEKLMTINGVSENLAESIKSQLEFISEESGVKLKLTKLGLTRYQVDRLYDELGDNAIKVFEENPYRLITYLDGFGFMRVDEMALRSGFVKPDSKYRILACVNFVANKALPNIGHTCQPIDEFCKFTGKHLEGYQELVQPLLKEAEENRLIKIQDNLVCSNRLYEFENGISKRLKEILSKKDELNYTEVPKDILSPCRGDQIDAVRNSLLSPVSVITGPPGSGKTWCLKQILKCFDQWGLSVALAAPTGKAARKMSESIKDKRYDCITIHRLLEYQMGVGFMKSCANPLLHDVIIIDEFSMVDTELAFHLFEASLNAKRIIIIGDIDQLPSVGPGKVMHSIIECPLTKVNRLRTIQRQAEGSPIIVNAFKVNKGIQIEYDNEVGNDFFFLEMDDKKNIAETIPMIVKKAQTEYGFDPISEVQILCPQKTGDIGTKALNETMRKLLNPKADPKKFDVNDRVIQIVNDYDLHVYNGDTGVIIKKDNQKKVYHIDFGYDFIHEYPMSLYKQLQFSYAITIHKSQGSEFPFVVIPIHTTNYIMLQRNLLYTAITRGKKKVVIIGSKKAVKIAVENYKPIVRYNRLEMLLSDINNVD